MAAERDRAQRAAAAAAERARLARAVHDGVLQVLALVQRRGAELGGEAAELGRLAGEQEVGAAHPDPRPGRGRVRRPTRRWSTWPPRSSASSTRPGVHVATPGRRSSCPRVVAAELVAAVGRLPRQRARRTSAPTRRPGCCSRRSRTGSRSRCATRGPASPTGRLEAADGRGPARRRQSIRGRLATSAGRRRCTPARTAPSGSWSLRSSPSGERSGDHPHLAPLRRPRARRRPAVPRAARRRGDAVDRRVGPTTGPASRSPR